MSEMNRQDPIDTLLGDAFAAERRALPEAPIARQVLNCIRRQRRRRQALLGSGLAGGLAATAASAGPLLTELGRALEALVPAAAAFDGAAVPIAAAALLLGFGVLVFLEEEASGL